MGPDANGRNDNSVFNSALVISAHVLLLLRDVAPLLPDLITSSLLDIEKAESIMEKLSTNGKTARSCLSFLHRLRTALAQLGIAPCACCDHFTSISLTYNFKANPILSANGNSMSSILSQNDSEYRESLPSGNSPFGPELGQFLLQSDFDFLSNLVTSTGVDAGTGFGFQNENLQETVLPVGRHQRQDSDGYAGKAMEF
jgi:hypothetical protein